MNDSMHSAHAEAPHPVPQHALGEASSLLEREEQVEREDVEEENDALLGRENPIDDGQRSQMGESVLYREY